VNPCAHHHPIAELAAYALDALDGPGERRAIEGHLAHCPLCRAELAAHERVLANLVDDEAPPASLWGGIAERVAGPAAVAVVSAQVTTLPPRAHGPGVSRPRALPAPARPPAGRPPVPSRGVRRPRRLGLAAAAVALVVAAAAAPFLAARRGDQPHHGPVAEVAAVIRDRGGDDLARVVERGGATYVVVDRRPPLPAGRTYQLWSVDGPRPVSLGLVGRGTGAPVPVTLPPGTRQVAVSAEPAGGSPAPTTMIGAGELT